MLEFINGGFRSEFGVSVIKANRHDDKYSINNKYTNNDLFVNKFGDGDKKGKFGDTTPSFGGTWDDNVDYENAKTVDEMLDELRLMKTNEDNEK